MDNVEIYMNSIITECRDGWEIPQLFTFREMSICKEYTLPYSEISPTATLLQLFPCSLASVKTSHPFSFLCFSVMNTLPTAAASIKSSYLSGASSILNTFSIIYRTWFFTRPVYEKRNCICPFLYLFLCSLSGT